jgi:hypothetical protein
MNITVAPNVLYKLVTSETQTAQRGLLTFSLCPDLNFCSICKKWHVTCIT